MPNKPGIKPRGSMPDIGHAMSLKPDMKRLSEDTTSLLGITQMAKALIPKSIELENATMLADRLKSFEERKLVEQTFKSHHLFQALSEHMKDRILRSMKLAAYNVRESIFS